MAWLVITLLLFAFLFEIALLGLVITQLLTLSDLEYDYINPYDSSSYINKLVVPEFLIQGGVCLISLFTGSWVLLLLCIPAVYYHVKLYVDRKHLLDVTEIFSAISREKKIRLIKLAYYLVVLVAVLVRLVMVLIEEDS